MKSLYSALTAIFVFAAPLAGIAQNPRQLQPNEHALNLPGATTIEAPPAGFDPITASDEELAGTPTERHSNPLDSQAWAPTDSDTFEALWRARVEQH